MNGIALWTSITRTTIYYTTTICILGAKKRIAIIRPTGRSAVTFSARYCYNYDATTTNTYIGWRPVLEKLNTEN